MSDVADPRLRTIRSFVVRAGRMTTAQQRAMDVLWPRWGLAFDSRPLDLDAVFGRKASRVLEIGFGNGEHLVQLASAHPETDFIGIEVHPPGVGSVLQRMEAAALTNLRICQHDAMEVLAIQIPAGSIEELLVLFPDPWHKKRHHKRRLVNASFARLVHSRLRPGGVLHLATDWTPYAEWMLEVLGAEPGFRNLSADGGWLSRDPNRSPTRFERRGERLGHEVHDLRFARLPDLEGSISVSGATARPG